MSADPPAIDEETAKRLDDEAEELRKEYRKRVERMQRPPGERERERAQAAIIAAIAESHRSMAVVDRRDLWHLVCVAYQHAEISIGKASELLGLPIEVCQRVLPGQGP